MLQGRSAFRASRIMPKFLVSLAVVVLTMHTASYSVRAQDGTLKGTVRFASGAPAPAVTVIATNQVTGKWKRTRSDPNGAYSLRLRAGAYRIVVQAPHVARFASDKDYGEFA